MNGVTPPRIFRAWRLIKLGILIFFTLRFIGSYLCIKLHEMNAQTYTENAPMSSNIRDATRLRLTAMTV
jgi:hypothetical protein